MKFSTLSFQNNPAIGLFAFATDGFCVTGRLTRKRHAKLIERVLNVPVHEASVLKTDLAGIFLAGNSRGVIVSNELHDHEIKHLESKVGVLVIDTRHTALGNLILANGKGCILSRELQPHKEAISRFLKVEAHVGTIAGLDIVGSLAVCNSKGCLAHKSIDEMEKHVLERTLKVPVLPGSVNFGNQWIRPGIIANSNGFLAGDRTSGAELGLAAEALGFV